MRLRFAIPAFVAASALLVTGCGGSSANTAPTPLGNDKMLIATVGASNDSIDIIGSDGVARVGVISAESDAPAISQDRTSMAFVRKVGGKDQIFVASIDGSGATQITNGSFKDGSPTFSPDGSKIYFIRDTDGAGSSQICSITIPGGVVTQITTPSNGGLPHNFSPTVSPDGTKLAFMQSPLGGSGTIVVANADGTNQVSISATGGTSPSWSPDGTKIAFSNAGVITVMNADGTNKTPVSTGTNDNNPTWSPDGSQIAFHSVRSVDGFTLQIFRVSAGGGTEAHVTSDQAHPAFDARWSRN